MLKFVYEREVEAEGKVGAEFLRLRLRLGVRLSLKLRMMR